MLLSNFITSFFSTRIRSRRGRTVNFLISRPSLPIYHYNFYCNNNINDKVNNNNNNKYFSSHFTSSPTLTLNFRYFQYFQYSQYSQYSTTIKMSSKTIPSIEHINHDELKDLIKDKSKIPGKDYLVVDVRDDDYEGGNIPNSINRQSSKIHDSVENLISEYNKVPQIIFTCALSKVRGPKCARIYSEELFLNKGIKTDQKVQVLKNGFEGWQSYYKDDPELVENYNKEIWDPDYN
ncbi:hypothetical protein Glove_340g14 [Diversispora epigaea]|uniref:Rhodanese domain-containing protein n=1 Tax=Diversispora epigaea TaxID=1348612 RepID=A0A397HGZ9_9GLOM|nr:hypothetical protein Glove_340g14 [Diversispora epigaea]